MKSSKLHATIFLTAVMTLGSYQAAAEGSGFEFVPAGKSGPETGLAREARGTANRVSGGRSTESVRRTNSRTNTFQPSRQDQTRPHDQTEPHDTHADERPGRHLARQHEACRGRS